MICALTSRDGKTLREEFSDRLNGFGVVIKKIDLLT